MVLALVLVMVVVALGAAYLQITTAVSSRQTNESDALRSFYLSEAGLAEAFHAVRVGRTGQVGSEIAPAMHGDGLLWVDATETVDEQVRLESTALCGRGRTTLALVVEPVEVPLGFFSEEDLVVDNVLLVDGFNSEEATYEKLTGGTGGGGQGPLDPELQRIVNWLLDHMTEAQLICYIESTGQVTKQKVKNQTSLGRDMAGKFVSMLPELRDAYATGALFPTILPKQHVDSTSLM